MKPADSQRHMGLNGDPLICLYRSDYSPQKSEQWGIEHETRRLLQAYGAKRRTLICLYRSDYSPQKSEQWGIYHETRRLLQAMELNGEPWYACIPLTIHPEKMRTKAINHETRRFPQANGVKRRTLDMPVSLWPFTSKNEQWSVRSWNPQTPKGIWG